MTRDIRLLLIGAFSGLAGLAVLTTAPLDDLSPLNQALMAVIVIGGAMWVTLSALKVGQDQ